MISNGMLSHKGWKEIGHTIIYLQVHQLCVYCAACEHIALLEPPVAYRYRIANIITMYVIKHSGRERRQGSMSAASV